MKHKHIINLLSDYLEDLLDDTTRQSVEKHLSSCARCKSKLDELQNYHQLVMKMEKQKAPEDIKMKVMELIESRRQTPDPRPQTLVSGNWRLETGGWKLVTGIAAIIILLVLVVPKEIFQPTVISSDVIAEVPKKRGKGGPAVTIGGVLAKGEEQRAESKGQRAKREENLGPSLLALSQSPDYRLQNLAGLLESVEAELISAQVSGDGATYSLLVVGMKKKAYKHFAEKYNELGMGEMMPPKAGLSLSNNVLVNLFPVKRNFYVKDFNEDGFDDLILQYTSGRFENQWFVSLNNHMDNFYPLLEIDPDSLAPATQTTDSTITFSGDFNGDGLIDTGTKYLEGEFISQFHVRFSMDEVRYSVPILFRFGSGVMAWQGEYTHYFGDFNADGLCDMLTKEGNGDVLGVWYLMLNDGNNGFGGSEQVRFGKSEYFISD